MRTELVVVPSPVLYLVSGIFQGNEPDNVQTFITETAIKRFDMRIVRRCPGAGIVESDLVEVRPSIQCSVDELRAVLDPDLLRKPVGCLDFFQFLTDLFALDRFVHVDG